MRPSSVRIMGILNITPDSFSDGGRFGELNTAQTQFDRLLQHGSDFIDIGAESSRPGAIPVDEALEWRRLEPILSWIEKRQLIHFVSVDTYKPAIMIKACQMGVKFINNIDGLVDAPTLEYLAKSGVSYIAMHKNGNPRDMQAKPLTGAECPEVLRSFFIETTEELRMAGFPLDNIWLDPGIGFGKTDAANLRALREVVLDAGQRNFVIGVSRKSWIGRILGIGDPLDRDPASKMIELGAMLSGVRMIRTHDVGPVVLMRRMLDGEIP
jgi:dihydropteroate synthase